PSRGLAQINVARVAIGVPPVGPELRARAGAGHPETDTRRGSPTGRIPRRRPEASPFGLRGGASEAQADTRRPGRHEPRRQTPKASPAETEALRAVRGRGSSLVGSREALPLR